MRITIQNARTLILSGQRLLAKEHNNVVQVVSDLSGIQYDPCPILHLHHYLALWNRIPGFQVTDYDRIAYDEGALVEANFFKRNLFTVPARDFDLYNAATERIVYRGESRAQQKCERSSSALAAQEEKLKQAFHEIRSGTERQLWAHLGLTEEHSAFKERQKQEAFSEYPPIFQAFYRMRQTNDIVVCGRLPGTFRQPVFALPEDLWKDRSAAIEVSNEEAVAAVLYKLICSYGVTDATHLKALTGWSTQDLSAAMAALKLQEMITDIHVEGLKKTYVAANKSLALLQQPGTEPREEVALLSPMEGMMRDQRWLNAFFSYSFRFEYFKKKGMKWPLAILANNELAGFVACKFDRKRKRFIVQEIEIQKEKAVDPAELYRSLCSLAKLHEAAELTILGAKYPGYQT